MKMTTRRVRRARRWVQANRCPRGPGITHDWRYSHREEPWDFTRGTADVEVYRCAKCGVTS